MGCLPCITSHPLVEILAGIAAPVELTPAPIDQALQKITTARRADRLEKPKGTQSY